MVSERSSANDFLKAGLLLSCANYAQVEASDISLGVLALITILGGS